MKKTLLIIGAIVVILLVAGGSFLGGMAYNESRRSKQANQAREDFFTARGGQPGQGQFPEGGQAAPGGFRGGGTIGKIKTIEGNVMTISTANNVTTVNLTDTTQIEKTTSGTNADLQPGVQVMISGETGSNGVVTAVRIQIINNLPSGMAYPPPGETAP